MAYQGALDTIAAASGNLVGRDTSTTKLTAGEKSWRGVDVPPADLHAAAGLDADIYALARCVASEVGQKATPVYQLAIAESVVREARVWKGGSSVFTMLTGRTRADAAWTAGKYGEQRGRWASTSNDPSGKNVAAARAALGGTTLTPPASKGARFFDAKVMDGGRQGDHQLRLDATGLVAEWGEEGWQWIGPLPGVDTYLLAVMHKVAKGSANNAKLVEAIERGRKGERMVGASDGADDMHRAAADLPWWVVVAGGIAFL